MGEARPRRDAAELEAAPSPRTLEQAMVEDLSAEDLEAADVVAWELIDAELGQYMPRRIRGSFRGRALG